MIRLNSGISPNWIAFSYEPCYKGDKLLILDTSIKYISNIAGYLPGVSTVTGLSRIIFASISMPYADNENDYLIANGHLFRGIIETCSIFGIILLVADIWNTFSNSKPSDASVKIEERNDLLEGLPIEDSISVEEIEIEEDVQNDYRPLYKKILPDENGRQKQRLLHTNRYHIFRECENELQKDFRYKYKTDEEKQKLRNEHREKRSSDVIFDELIHGKYLIKDLPEKKLDFLQAFPVGKINQNTTLNQFFRICQKSQDYQLHHANGGRLPEELIRTTSLKNSGLNAISAAIRVGNVELLKGLLNIAPELVNLEGIEGVTPLMFACAFENPDVAFEMAEIILQNKGVNINLQTLRTYFTECNRRVCSLYNLEVLQGATAIWIAASMRNHKLVELLVRHEAKFPAIIKSYAYTNDLATTAKAVVSETLAHLELVNFVIPHIIKTLPDWAVKKAFPLIVMRDNEEIPNDLVIKIFQIFSKIYLEDIYIVESVSRLKAALGVFGFKFFLEYSKPQLPVFVD
ncbi:MAG: ankyrin repeat domain-containing protein [Parachlamydiaceae bacterium]|nr:ankyrin repeat domain-containing protein [Parachlamydiaceae bacterium]